MGITERKQRDLENKTTAILDAAEKVFFDKGFLAATVEDIAVESEYSVGTLYNTIGNKESILASLVLRISSMVLAEQPKISAKPDAAVIPQLEKVFHFYIDFWYSHKAYLPIVFLFESPELQQRAKPQLVREFQDLRQSYSETLFKLIKKGQKAGEIRSDASPEKLGVIFFGFLHSFLQGIDAPQALEAERRYGFELKDVVHKGISMLLESLSLSVRTGSKLKGKKQARKKPKRKA